MAIYDFTCTNKKCNNTFEKVIRNDQNPPCPICGAVTERMISAPAVVLFNGTGFYETDYKHK